MEEEEFMKPMDKLVTDLTESPEVAEFLSGAQSAAEATFVDSGGDLSPVCLFTKGGKMGVVDIRQGMQNEETKDGVADMMRTLRQDCLAVIFVSEIWMSNPPVEKKPDDVSKDEFLRKQMENIVPPSQDPNRKEAVMLQLYVGKDSHCFINMINREGGPNLEGWKAMPSTKNQSPDGYSQQGRFV